MHIVAKTFEIKFLAKISLAFLGHQSNDFRSVFVTCKYNHIAGSDIPRLLITIKNTARISNFNIFLVTVLYYIHWRWIDFFLFLATHAPKY